MSSAGKSPAIFILPDLRASSGKSDLVIQRLGHVMAKLGYLVFAFDPMGQGERRSASAEDAELLSLGVSPAGIDEYEIKCGLAYLASLIGVDGGRIGFVSSGGSAFRALASLAVENTVTSAAMVGDSSDWAQVVRYLPLDSPTAGPSGSVSACRVCCDIQTMVLLWFFVGHYSPEDRGIRA